MHTPAYFGSIGVMNAPHLDRARRRPGILAQIGFAIAGAIRRLTSGTRRAPGGRRA